MASRRLVLPSVLSTTSWVVLTTRLRASKLVRLKLTGEAPAAEAVTVYRPGVVPAVAVTLARPPVIVVGLVEKLAVAPEVGAENTTWPPSIGLVNWAVLLAV